MNAFREAVVEYLKPYAGNFNYDVMLSGMLDTSRYSVWIAEISKYKAITNSVVFSSGCSSGGDLWTFLEAGASSVYGIEVDPPLVALAQTRFQGTSYQNLVDIRWYDGYILPYVRESFDIIISMHVIEHTKNPELYLTELFRVLRPGGVIFLDVPNRYYRLEQHTEMPYIHFLPMPIRDIFLKLILLSPFAARLSEQTRYKLGTYIGYHFPSPGQIVGISMKNLASERLTLTDVFFHSYTNAQIRYAQRFASYFWGPQRKMTTFRIVIGKQN